MTTEFEMTDLSRDKNRPQTDDSRSTRQDVPADSAVSSWAWCAAALLLLLSSCLTLSPRFLLFISESASNSESRTVLTPLESFLALHFGIWLVAVALSLVLNIPSSLPPIVPQQGSTPSHPLLTPLTFASILSSFLAYNTSNVGALSFIVSICSGMVGLWGLWVIMFAGSSSISKTTGADKHTSAFIFGNKNAASIRKRLWKQGQRAKEA